MATNLLGPEEVSTPFMGFDTGVYTLYIGPDQKKLTIPGYILTRIAPINKLIIDKNLVENEPVSLEAYDPEAFATVLALVRDGYDAFKVPKTSQQLIKAYIVAYDLNLEEIKNFLINHVKIFHWTHPVQPQDFELLHVADLTSDCKIYAFLLHKMAHDFHTGLYRNVGPEGGITLSPEYVKRMTCLRKVDLIQLSHQVTLLSTKWQCAPCQDACSFHDHVFTPNCTTAKIDGHDSPKIPAAAAAQLEANAKNHIFRFTIKKTIPTTKTKIAQALHATCVTEDSNTVTSDLRDSYEDYTGSTSYTKVAQWLNATADSKEDEPRSVTLATEKPLPARTGSSKKISRNQSDATVEFTEGSFVNLATPRTNPQSKAESDLQKDWIFTLPQPSTCQEASTVEVAPTSELSKSSRAPTSRPKTDAALEEVLRERGIPKEVTVSNPDLLGPPPERRSPSLSSHASEPQLSSEVVQSITKYSHNEDATCGEDVPGGQKCSSESSAQEDELTVCNGDSSSSEEDVQESEPDSDASDIEQFERQKENLKYTGTFGLVPCHVRSLSDILQEITKRMEDIHRLLENLHEQQRCIEEEIECFADHTCRNTQEQRISSHTKTIPAAYNQNSRIPGNDPAQTAAAQALEEKVCTGPGAISHGPPTRAFDFLPVYGDTVREPELNFKSAEESNESSIQTVKLKVHQESQDYANIDDDKVVLSEVAREIESFKKDLGI